MTGFALVPAGKRRRSNEQSVASAAGANSTACSAARPQPGSSGSPRRTHAGSDLGPLKPGSVHPLEDELQATLQRGSLGSVMTALDGVTVDHNSRRRPRSVAAAGARRQARLRRRHRYTTRSRRGVPCAVEPDGGSPNATAHPAPRTGRGHVNTPFTEASGHRLSPGRAIHSAACCSSKTTPCRRAAPPSVTLT